MTTKDNPESYRLDDIHVEANAMFFFVPPFEHLPCKFTVQVVLLPRSNTTTLVAAAILFRIFYMCFELLSSNTLSALGSYAVIMCQAVHGGVNGKNCCLLCVFTLLQLALAQTVQNTRPETGETTNQPFSN